MAPFPAFRSALRATLVAGCLFASVKLLWPQPASAGQKAGLGQHSAAGSHPAKPQQEHLGQWLDRHRNLPLPQQQNELEKEPGFRELPQQTQQRLRNQLSQLNNMPEDQRRRRLARTEAMEQLSPQQRQQFRGAVQQLGGLPPDRRRLVARAFLDIRDMPIQQRQAVLNSDRFRGQFSDQERATLSNLLTVEPYLPPQRPNDAP